LGLAFVLQYHGLMIQPFHVHIDDTILDDLKRKIVRTHWPDEIRNAGWQHGVAMAYMKDLTAYWATTFDWHKAEEKINAYPHFIAGIDGCKIHYLHIKGRGKNAIPLILTHGWPGSFLEFMRCIPLLTADDRISFDLVVPSLPGYGFSQKPDQEGMNTARIAMLWARLMQELGYEKFLVQGGDFGAEVSTHLALQQPERVIGLHLNYVPFSYKPYLPPGEDLTAEEKSASEKTVKFFQSAGAYAQQHVTQPLTLSYGLSDSPAGLAAWILQIFKNFSDPSKDIEQLFERDELLANITLYWVTGTIHSSIRLYGETMKKPLIFKKEDYITPPVGIAHYPFPDSFPAKKYVERGFNVQYWKDLPAGGHFAAMEQPAIFAADIKDFAGTLIR
jgi:pimeloyl-ACP methyl ester carboxylesterase